MKHLPSPASLRTSVIVPKSVAKQAVERNRLRRAAYHALDDATGNGKAILFVQRKPERDLQLHFREDIMRLLTYTR
jgi:ribonuclease P protein component